MTGTDTDEPRRIAPRAGAWIEIRKAKCHLTSRLSHLVQVRGLKSV